jgi:hypothetical protein
MENSDNNANQQPASAPQVPDADSDALEQTSPTNNATATNAESTGYI